MYPEYETEARNELIEELRTVSHSLADWARDEFASGETIHSVKHRLREAMEAANRS